MMGEQMYAIALNIERDEAFAYAIKDGHEVEASRQFTRDALRVRLREMQEAGLKVAAATLEEVGG